MKNTDIKNRVIFALVLLSAIILLSRCGSSDADPAPTPATEKEKVTESLTSGNWKMQSVMVDGVDQTSVYKGLAITFTSTGITVTNGGAIFPSSATWSFTDETGKAIQLGNGLSMTVEEASATRLVLKLTSTKTTLGPGRVTSVSGQHVFVFGH